MQFAYVTALIDLEVPDTLPAPLEIKAGLFLTNNSTHLARYVQSQHLSSIGFLEGALLTGRSAVLYRTADVLTPELAKVEVINFLREVQGFRRASR